MRQNISSGSPWEDVVGYSRAVNVGGHVFVAGTTGTDAQGCPISPDAYGQARYALEKILRALKEAGASAEHVVRTRMYVVDISQWEEVGRAHGEVFRDVKPASSMVEVRRLIGDGVLVEIEAEAVVH